MLIDRECVGLSRLGALQLGFVAAPTFIAKIAVRAKDRMLKREQKRQREIGDNREAGNEGIEDTREYFYAKKLTLMSYEEETSR